MKIYNKSMVTDGIACELRIALASSTRSLAYVTLLTFSLYLIMLATFPLEPVFRVDWNGSTFLITTAMFALLGASLQKYSKSKSIRVAEKYTEWGKISNIVTIISTFGVVVILVDRFLFRGVGLELDSFEAREALEASSVGFFGMIGAYAASFSAFGVIIHWIAKEYGELIGYPRKILAYANLIIYIYLSAMLGSRSLLIVVIICHLFARATLRQSQGKKSDYKSVVILISVIIATIAALIYILQQRLTLMGISALDSLQYSAYAYTLRVNDAVLDLIRGGELVESLGGAIFSMLLYIFHGAFEFLYLFDNLEGHHTYGAETFWLLIKIAGTIVGSFDKPDLELIHNYRSGVFTTFAGPLFLDFGLLAPFAIGIIFYFLSIPQKLVANGKVHWMPACLQCETIVVLSPILNLLQSATGTYLLVAAISIALMGSCYRQNAKDESVYLSKNIY